MFPILTKEFKPIKNAFISIVFMHISLHKKKFTHFRYSLSLIGYQFLRCNFVKFIHSNKKFLPNDRSKTNLIFQQYSCTYVSKMH